MKELGAWDEAERVIGYGVSAFPSEMALPLLMGDTLLAQQRWQAALPWFQQAVAMSPKNADAYYGLGRVALGLGGREEAAKLLMRALQSNPYDVDAARLLQDVRSRATVEGKGS